MQTKLLKACFSIAIMLIANNLMAQGCSDAGFCTISGFKPNANQKNKTTNNQFKVGIASGSANYSISVLSTYLEYNRKVSAKVTVDAKLTAINQSGNGISSFGMSDVFLNTNYLATNNLTFTVGGKIPLSNANKTNNNISLPMDYQSSLGTMDLIVGMGYLINKVQLVAALQQPLTQNSNHFFAEMYPSNSKLRSFQSTNNYKRSADVLLRISCPIEIDKKFKITPSLLPIYHLKNDKYTDVLNVQKEITDSKGLTLNTNFYFDYTFNAKQALQLNIGMPMVARKQRPDGLTRSFIANLEYKIAF